MKKLIAILLVLFTITLVGCNLPLPPITSSTGSGTSTGSTTSTGSGSSTGSQGNHDDPNPQTAEEILAYLQEKVNQDFSYITLTIETNKNGTILKDVFKIEYGENILVSYNLTRLNQIVVDGESVTLPDSLTRQIVGKVQVGNQVTLLEGEACDVDFSKITKIDINLDAANLYDFVLNQTSIGGKITDLSTMISALNIEAVDASFTIFYGRLLSNILITYTDSENAQVKLSYSFTL